MSRVQIKLNVQIMFLFCCLMQLLPMAVNAQEEGMSSKILAVVGDEVILSSEVELAVAMSPYAGEIESEEAYNQFIKRQLDELINEKLILIAAKDDSIEVSSEEVDRIWDDRWTQIQSSFATEEQLEAALSNEGYTLSEFKRRMKKQINDFLIKQRFIERNFGFIEVSKNEVEEFYNEFKDSLPPNEPRIRLSVLVISIEEDTSVNMQVMNLIQTIYDEFESGVSFEDLARSYSVDSISASSGGEVGNFERGMLPQPLDSVAFSLEPGQISDPVQSQLGYHLLMVNDKTEEGVNLSHILIKVPVSLEREAKLQELADKAYKEALSDTITFGELVHKYSQDTTYTKNDGDLGWFSMSEISMELKEIILDHEMGEVLPPIFEMGEYHIFKITDFQQAEPLNLDNNYDMLKNYTKQRKQMTKLKNFLDNFKDEVYIEIRWEEE